MNHIVILNTAHHSFDDRVFYHQAKSLVDGGYRTTIVSTVETVDAIKENINIYSSNLNSFSHKEKQQKIVEQLNELTPDIIICDTPNAVLYSCKYRKEHKTKIIYDVTEWYPSAYNLRNIKGIKKWIRGISLIFFNLYAGLLSDGFIFGEYYKAKIFRFFYFWKPYLYLSYFPDLKYINPSSVQDIRQTIRLFYGGSLQSSGGLSLVIQSIIKAAQRKPNVVFQLHIVCDLLKENDILYFEKLIDNIPSNIEIHHKQLFPFVDFCQYITNMDLFFDLRTISFENNHSLPIKLFYYIACGRPVIYSKLKSIKTFFPGISFGYLVSPADSNTIANYIVSYIDNQDVYIEHCQNALTLSKEKYNWAKIETDFIDFIQRFSN